MQNQLKSLLQKHFGLPQSNHLDLRAKKFFAGRVQRESAVARQS